MRLFKILLPLLVLAGCSNDFSALQGTATLDEERKPDPPPAKVLLVGDAFSPSLASHLKEQNLEVVDVPYSDLRASDDLQVGGDYIVWSDNRSGDLDLYAYKISEDREFAITTAEGKQHLPKISGDYVVWQDHRNGNSDIYAYRFSTGEEIPISTAPKNQEWPDIDGDYIVWHDYRNKDADIYAYHIPSRIEIDISKQQPGDQLYPKVSGDYVVWKHVENGYSDIYGYQFSTQTTFTIANVANSSQFEPQISGDYVVWMDNRKGSDDIYGYHISSASEFVVTNNIAQQRNLRLDGDYVVWQDDRNGNSEIFAYQLSTGDEFDVVSVDTGVQTLPAISGEYVVWQNLSSGNIDIYGSQLRTDTVNRITSETAVQRRPVIDGGTIAWLDERRGVLDVMYSQDQGGTHAIASNGWLTPAGLVGRVADYEVLIMGSDFLSEQAMLDLYDAAVAAKVGIIGLGGEGLSLAKTLANAGRYGISVTPDSGCGAMQISAVPTSADKNALFKGISLSGYIDLEAADAVARDELVVETDTTAIDSPTDWTILAYFGTRMCNPGKPAIVEYTDGDPASIADDTASKVLLDGTASIADNYTYWSLDRWVLLFNAVGYVRPSTEVP